MTKNNKDNSMCNKYHLLFCIFAFAICLMLLPFEQLIFITGSASANSENMIDYRLNGEIQNEPALPKEDIQQTLRRTNITPAEDQKEQVQKDELRLLIEQLNSIELLLPQQSIEVTEVNDSVMPAEQEINKSKNQTSKPAEQNNKIDNKLYELLTEQTIQRLKKMAEKPEEVDNPYEIGNTLYLSNNIGEAAAFYKEALKRKQPDDMSSSDDRAWLLFQTGNSLRSIDMFAAAEMYGKLITEYPGSPWADYARVQSNIITWYTKDKPDDLLKEYKR